MDDKEFRKLRREDLVEIIYQYQRREQRMAQEIEMLRRQLEDRQIRLEKTGSIAEAALALSGIFEAAQQAADLYLKSIQEHSNPEKLNAQPAVPAQQAEPKAVPEPAKPPKPAEKPRKPETAEKPAEKPAPEKEKKQPQKLQTPEKPQKEPPKDPPKAAKAEKAGEPPKKPQRPPIPQKKAAVPQKKAEMPASGKPEAAGKDTDEFIASLKDYLGM